MKIGYLISEFPGQTHVWMWREIVHLREWGAKLRIFSTRPPLGRDLARHGFAESARQETTYLGSEKRAAFAAVAWALLTRPIALLRCIVVALTLPVETRPRWRKVLPLVAPACLLARRVRREGIAHLHCHTCANGAILAMMNQRLTGVPYSLTLNANPEWWGGAMSEKFGESRFTIAIATWLLDQVRRDYPAPRPDQAVLGRIGVDTRKWTPPLKTRQTAARRRERTRIVSLGRLHSSKGFDTLLRALPHVLAAGADASLNIIGAGPERDSLGKLVADLGLRERVAFLGSLSEERIIEELREADLFVLASHAEPLGVVYMEAMAMGVATIGTAAGGVREIIDDGENGLLVPPQNEMALAAAMLRVIENPDLRQSLAAAGRASTVARFDSRLGAAVLFERLTGQKPPSSVSSPSEALPSRHPTASIDDTVRVPQLTPQLLEAKL